jgi:hypothetical protein
MSEYVPLETHVQVIHSVSCFSTAISGYLLLFGQTQASLKAMLAIPNFD